MIALSISFFLVILLVMGMPVGFALALSGSVGLLATGGIALLDGILQTTPLSTANSFELLTVPMFLLMAEFVILSGVADNLFEAASRWVGRLPGGLGVATALAGAGFGAISGSSVAAAATLSATSIPAMLKQGYEPKLACGVVAISGTLAMLIPPSIAIVLYGIIAEVSIGKLLIAGIIPGILVTLTIALTVLCLVAIDPSRAPPGPKYTIREKLESLKVAGPMLLLFAGVTGVIYTGIATPTEASGIGAFMAFLLALQAGKMNFQTTLDALVRAARTTCMVIMIILGAQIFGYFFTLTQTTQIIVTTISALDVNRHIVLGLILLIYILLGCFLDTIAILFLTIPIVLPIVRTLQFDPVWFGILVIVTCEVGLLTPPVGMNCFVVSRYSGRPLAEVFGGAMPHVYAHLLLITLLIVFPQLVIWLPSTMIQ
jgi:tripartite ATP-independent transporter DctM subunit